MFGCANNIVLNKLNNAINNTLDSHKNVFETVDKIMILSLFVENEELKQKYIDAATIHNSKILTSDFPDAGFDLFVPSEITVNNSVKLAVNHEIKSSAIILTDTYKKYNTGFYLYPRSSISNTPLRLANSTGIIDSGYRGFLIGKFDCIDSSVTVKKYDRLLQIVAPGMVPIIVQIVNTIEELSELTERGEGGFGSTGR